MNDLTLDDFKKSHVDGVLRVPCSKCAGRGWEKDDRKDWPDPCAFCNGKGAFSRRQILKRIGVAHTTLDRFLRDRQRLQDKTIVRVREALREKGFIT